MLLFAGVSMSQAKCIEVAKQKKREVDLSNTRFVGNPFTETLSQAAMMEASAVQASKKEGKVGVDGKCCFTINISLMVSALSLSVFR